MRKAIEPTGPGPDQTSLLLHGQILDEGGTGADIEEQVPVDWMADATASG